LRTTERDFCGRVRGREARTSLTPEGVNAIEFAARLIAFIRNRADRLSRDEPRDMRFAVPYTTLQTGVISGGIAVNVVPRDCNFHFEMRNLPAASQDALSQEIFAFAERHLVPEMHAVAAGAGIGFATEASICWPRPAFLR
jgi:acetylornithine deacetylase